MRVKSTKKEKFDLEALFHMGIHFLGVLALFWLAIVPPVYWAIGFLILEIVQMKVLGNCFLTVMAHKRGYMRGKTYWQYVPYVMGVKNWKKADKIISAFITFMLVAILVVRLVLI